MLAEMHRLRAQHQVREIDIPRMRRHVRTLGHVAHVAQITLIDDVLVLLLRHAVDFAGGTVVDQIEQRRKCTAQTDAAATSVADVENAFQLRVERRSLVEVRGFPRKRMPRRRFEAAFAHGHRDFPEEKFNGVPCCRGPQ